MEKRLRAYFDSFTKDELTTILGAFEQPFRKTARKADLVSQVCDLIGLHADEWLYCLSERDLRLLQKAVAAGPLEDVDIDAPEFPTCVDVLPFFEVDTEEGEYHTHFYLVPVIYDIVKEVLPAVMEEKELDHSFEAERLLLGYLNLWGIISTKDFVSMLFTIFDGDEAILQRIVGCPLVGIFQVVHKGEVYLLSPYVDDYEFILRMRKDFKEIKEYHPFTPEEALRAGSRITECIYGEDSDEGQAVMMVLSSLGLSAHDIEQEMHNIYISSQYTMNNDAAENLFDTVNSRVDSIPTFDEFRHDINVLAAYSNTIPKWILKGETSLDTDFLKLSIRIDDSMEQEFAQQGEEFDQEVPSFLNPGEDVGVPSAAGLSDFFKYGFAVRHVGADDPCPCGSGLSYRRCHGKNLS